MPSKPGTHKKKKFKKSGIAPLVQFDKNELGDKRLNPEEAVIREREDLLRMEQKKKYWHQEELADENRSSGARLQWTEFLRRLRKVNIGIIPKDGMPGSIALYFHKRNDEYQPSDFEWDMSRKDPFDTFHRDHKYVGGFPKRELPEWAHLTGIDSSGIATREYRGWRSVLMSLIKAHVLTYKQAVEEFGDPAGDPRARFWFDGVGQFKYRN